MEIHNGGNERYCGENRLNQPYSFKVYTLLKETVKRKVHTLLFIKTKIRYCAV
jgi:hypothetical protein